jgi:hypothetical protein
LERTLLAVLIYAWLKKLFSSRIAVFSAITTTILGSQGFADPVDAYHQLSELFAIASGLSLSWAFLFGVRARTFVVSAILCGVFAGITMCTKQSVGALTLVAMPAIALLIPGVLQKKTKLASFLLLYGVGCFLVFSLLIAWLLSFGALNAFFLQVFVQAPAAKAAHPLDYLIRFFVASKQFFLSLIGAIVLISFNWKSLVAFATRRRTDFIYDARSVVIPFCFIAVSIIIGIVSAFNQPVFNSLPAHIVFTFTLSRLLAFLGVLCLPTYLCYYLLVRFRHPANLSARQTNLFVFCSVSMVNLVASALSFPLIVEMIVPGLALIVAATTEQVSKKIYGINIGVWCLFIALATNFKCTVPFGLDGIFEKGGSIANSYSSQPQLKGMLLPAQTVEFVDSTADFIKKHTLPGDTIYSYPECGIMYALTDRKFPTFSAVHIIDVLNDKFGREEAARLIKNRPAVLIYIPDPVGLIQQEKIWRFGKPSGNRALIKACETLAREYILVSNQNISLDKRVYVYVRPDRK